MPARSAAAAAATKSLTTRASKDKEEEEEEQNKNISKCCAIANDEERCLSLESLKGEGWVIRLGGGTALTE